jgi:hypothetical protein
VELLVLVVQVVAVQAVIMALKEHLVLQTPAAAVVAAVMMLVPTPVVVMAVLV